MSCPTSAAIGEIRQARSRPNKSPHCERNSRAMRSLLPNTTFSPRPIRICPAAHLPVVLLQAARRRKVIPPRLPNPNFAVIQAGQTAKDLTKTHSSHPSKQRNLPIGWNRFGETNTDADQPHWFAGARKCLCEESVES